MLLLQHLAYTFLNPLTVYLLKPDLFQAAPQDGSTLGTVVTTSAGERKSPTGLMLKQNANHDILQPTWPLYTVKKNRTLL